MEFECGKVERDVDDEEGLLGLLEVLGGFVVRFVASLALRDSVKHEATRCMESPSGVTTLLRWCRYLLASMYSPLATASAHASSRCTSWRPLSCSYV